MLRINYRVDHTSLFSNIHLMKKELYIILDHLENEDSIKIHIFLDKFKHLVHQLVQVDQKMW